MLRKAFPEFLGSQLNVSFHKSWTTIREYVSKQDKAAYCWGTTKEECYKRLHRRKTGKKGLGLDLVTRLRRCSTWQEVLEDDVLVKRLCVSYSSVKQTFLDMKGATKLPPPKLREPLCHLHKEEMGSEKAA